MHKSNAVNWSSCPSFLPRYALCFHLVFYQSHSGKKVPRLSDDPLDWHCSHSKSWWASLWLIQSSISQSPGGTPPRRSLTLWSIEFGESFLHCFKKFEGLFDRDANSDHTSKLFRRVDCIPFALGCVKIFITYLSNFPSQSSWHSCTRVRRGNPDEDSR